MKNKSAKFAIKSKRVLQGNKFKEAVVLIEDGRIKDIITGPLPAGYDMHDVGDKVVMPGLVDSHVHINEPGRTEWEGFETATRAAAAGGITTITDMPLNCIPVTTSAAAFDEKLRHISGRLWVDLCFWGGVVPGNARELDRMIDQGVMGFKCFLIHSGIDDFPNVKREDLEVSMPILARRGVPLLVHAELEHSQTQSQSQMPKPTPTPTQTSHSKSKSQSQLQISHSDQSHQPYQPHIDEPRTYSHFLASRPRHWENEAIELMIELCRKYDCRVHIVHLSSSDAIAAIKAAKAEGLPFTTETCPHYLTLAAEDIADGDTRFKCAPPIRERENSDKLWQGLKEGTIDFVVSDHSPCTPELKHMGEGNFYKAWGGIASLQFGLPAIWTEAQKRGHDLATVVSWMSAGPARFLGLDNKKGALAPGFDADIVVFDPEDSFVVEPAMIHHRHKVTPHEGRKFHGVVCETYVRGDKVYDNGHFAKAPSGKALMRNKLGEKVDANVNS